MSDDNARWADLCRRGTIALVLIALLFPIASLVWTWGTWHLAGENVRYWKGDAASGDLPRLVEISKERMGSLRYYWYAIASENAATRWWTSVIAVLGGVFLLMAAAIPHRERPELREWAPWLVTGIGLIGIGLDERFQIHETIRNRIVQPAGVGDSLDWLNPGDIIMFIYPVGGVAIWWLLFRSLGKDTLSRGILIALIPIGAVAIGLDILDIDSLDRYPGWVYSGLVEEFGEWAVAALMTVVAWRRLTGRLAAD